MERNIKKFIIEIEEGQVIDCYNCPFNNLNCDKYDLLDCNKLDFSTMKIKEYEDTNEGKALLYAVEKTAERTKKEIVNKACEWLVDNARNYIVSNGGGYWYDSVNLKHQFKKAMEEEK